VRCDSSPTVVLLECSNSRCASQSVVMIVDPSTEASILPSYPGTNPWQGDSHPPIEWRRKSGGQLRRHRDRREGRVTQVMRLNPEKPEAGSDSVRSLRSSTRMLGQHTLPDEFDPLVPDLLDTLLAYGEKKDRRILADLPECAPPCPCHENCEQARLKLFAPGEDRPPCGAKIRSVRRITFQHFATVCLLRWGTPPQARKWGTIPLA